MWRTIKPRWTVAASPAPSQLNGPCSIANPHSVPTPSRWHPPPATAHADSAGEEYVSVPEVSKVVEVMKVMEADEVVVWNHRGMVASPSGGHVWTMHTTSAVHTAHAMHTAHHRVGRHRWRGKHRHRDSASNHYFAEHDDSPDCPRAIVRTKCKMFK